jgi:ribonuclease-3
MDNQEDHENPEQFAGRLGLKFSNVSLLSRALTHRSYLNENPHVLEDNERLEFLGDAVLNYFCASWLYHRFPEMKEGDLTALRAAIVRNEQLAEFARDIHLGRAVKMGRGEVDAGGRNRVILLGSVFEALLGALYLDGGIAAVSDFLIPLLAKTIPVLLSHLHTIDPKSRLQEYIQAKGLGTPRYRTISTSGPLHQPVYTVEVFAGEEVLGQGRGTNKQAATKAAAEEAIKHLGIDD